MPNLACKLLSSKLYYMPGFQSPQKPKGDCDSITDGGNQGLCYRFQSPQKPKGDCDYYLNCIYCTYPYLWFQSPQKPKGDCDCRILILFLAHSSRFQSPQKPKGDCDRWSIMLFTSSFMCSNHPKSRKAIVTILLPMIFKKL